MNNSMGPSCARFARAALCAFAVVLCASAGAQSEQVVTVTTPPGSFAVRGMAARTVGATAATAYVVGSSAASPGAVLPTLIQFMNTTGALGGGVTIVPTGAGSWFDLHSISERAAGGWVVAGRSFGGGMPGMGATVALLDANLNITANVEPSGWDPTAPNTEALQLPTGEIVQMVNAPVGTGRASAWLIFWSPTLNSVVKWNGYSNSACAQLRFTDMVFHNDMLYVVGYKIDTTHPGATQPILLEVNADPTVPANFGTATKLWSFTDFAVGNSASRFTALAVSPVGGTELWIAGNYQDITQPVSIFFGRLVRFRPSTGTNLVDEWYFPATVVPAGCVYVAPNGNCNLGFYTDRVHITGHSNNGELARHLRFDAITGQFALASEFSGSTPGLTRFYAQVPTTGSPDKSKLGGYYRTGGVRDLYLVDTNCAAGTNCSTAISGNTGLLGTTPVVETPNTQPITNKCDGSFLGGIVFASRVINTPPIVFSGTVTFCPNCPQDISGGPGVDGADLGALLGMWGACADCSADFNQDGLVDGADLGSLLGAWGAACE